MFCGSLAAWGPTEPTRGSLRQLLDRSAFSTVPCPTGQTDCQVLDQAQELNHGFLVPGDVGKGTAGDFQDFARRDLSLDTWLSDLASGKDTADSSGTLSPGVR